MAVNPVCRGGVSDPQFAAGRGAFFLAPMRGRAPLAKCPKSERKNPMCGRFTLRAPTQDVANLFDVLDVPALTPRYNIAPTQPVLCIGQNSGRRAAGFMRWGLVPSWADDPKIGSNFINARGETVGSKNAFRDAFRKRRCLIPADGFFDCNAHTNGKHPYRFQRPESRPFAFAWLWERWEPEDGPPLLTCCLITT